MTHGCYRGCRRPESGSDFSVVARTADFDRRGGDHTAEGGGGHPAPEPQGAPRGVRAVPKHFHDDLPEDSLRDGGIKKTGYWVAGGYASGYGVAYTEGHGGTHTGLFAGGTGPKAGGAYDDESATVLRNY